jgi:hypothetical protein
MTYEEVAEKMMQTANRGLIAFAKTDDGITVSMNTDNQIKNIYNITLTKSYDGQDEMIGKIYGVWNKALPDTLQKIDEKKIRIIIDPDTIGSNSSKANLQNVLNILDGRHSQLSFFDFEGSVEDDL